MRRLAVPHRLVVEHVAAIRDAALARERQAREAQEALALASIPQAAVPASETSESASEAPPDPGPATPDPDLAARQGDAADDDNDADRPPEQPAELLAKLEVDDPPVAEIIAKVDQEPRKDSPREPAPELYSNKRKAGGVTY